MMDKTISFHVGELTVVE